MNKNNSNTLNEYKITELIQNFIEDNYKHKQMLFTGDKEILNSKNSWDENVAIPTVELLNTYYNNTLLTNEHINLLYWGHVPDKKCPYNPRKWTYLSNDIFRGILGLNNNYTSLPTYVIPYNFINRCSRCGKEYEIQNIKTRSQLIQDYSTYMVCPECECYKKSAATAYIASVFNLNKNQDSIKVKDDYSMIEKPSQPIHDLESSGLFGLYKETLNTLKYMPYKEYLQTDHWLHFRDEALKWSQNRCQLCGKTHSLNVHHKTYDNRGRETFNDIIVLCQNCHSKFHDKI